MPHRLTFDSDLHRFAWVQAQLKVRGKSFSSVARDHGLAPSTVRDAMYEPMRRAQEAIAAALDLEPPVLFPERYDADGNRRRYIRKNSRNAVPHAVQKHGAA